METRAFGRTGVLAEVDNLTEVLQLYAALQQRRSDGGLDGVCDLIPAARTVLLRLDPERTSVQDVRQQVHQLDVSNTAGTQRSHHRVEIPVTYDGEDLAEACALTGWDVDELVRRHTSEEWTVAFCGFAPGFGYLVSASSTWSVPRRTTPRTRVPAGSVALAGEFSAVYPRESPGGWQLIGRTPLQMFDLDRDPPALLAPGTQVRFVVDDTSAPTPAGNAT